VSTTDTSSKERTDPGFPLVPGCQWKPATETGGHSKATDDWSLVYGAHVVGKVMRHEDGETWVGYLNTNPESELEVGGETGRFEYQGETAAWVAEQVRASLVQPEPKPAPPEQPATPDNIVDAIANLLLPLIQQVGSRAQTERLGADEYEFATTTETVLTSMKPPPGKVEAASLTPPSGKGWLLDDWKVMRDTSSVYTHVLLWARKRGGDKS